MAMDAARWDRIQAVFHDVTDLAEPARRARLDEMCDDDAALRDEVLALLDEDARGGSLLEGSVADVAERVLGDDALPRTPFGAYHVTGMLGEGGMGVVYLAERDDLGSRAAVKILRDAWLSPARRARFASEQRTLAQLGHPSIARLFDAGTLADGTPWIVMEYVDGVPLTTYCDAHASTVAERLTLFRAVCDAVQHAHGHAVIHRDLKPSNILVTAAGEAKLLDFGIAKQLDRVDAPADATRTGLRLMTPAYAAPEQLRGDGVGVHTDVYALGVVLYELLAGRLPFDLAGRTPGEAEALILEQEPPRPSVVRRTGGRAGGRWRASWDDLDVLCLTAMHKDPARRYRTVDALARDVDRYLRGEPLEARRDTVGYRLRKFVGRHRRAVGAAALVLAAAVALVAFYTARLTTARNAAVAEAARTTRIQRFMLNLFQGGDEAAGPADSLRVVTLVDRGVQQARALDAEPLVQAEVYATLGSLYQKLGRLDGADSLLRTALDRRRALEGPAHPDVGESLVALGLLRLDQAKYEEAERLVREGRAVIRARLGPDDPAVVQATDALGRVLEERGSYDAAVAVLDTAVRLHMAAADTATPELAASLRELASVHFYAGHFAVADSIDRRVLTMSRRFYGDRHPFVAADLVNLGAVQHEQGHYAEAERYYRQALAISRAWYGEDHFETAAKLTMLGRTLVYEERPDEAVALLREALAIRERVYGPNHPDVASTVNELGNIAVQRGRYDEAEAAFERMLAIYRAAYGENHYLLGTAISNLGSVASARKDNVRAERRFREALAIYGRTLPPDHLNVGIARIKLGRSLLRQGRFAEAAVESLAGHDIVAKQADASVSYLKAARADLAAAYDSLGQPARAARFRLEPAANADTAKRR